MLEMRIILTIYYAFMVCQKRPFGPANVGTALRNKAMQPLTYMFPTFVLNPEGGSFSFRR